jgi:hypothetical protein
MEQFKEFGLTIVDGKRTYQVDLNSIIVGPEYEHTVPYQFRYQDIVLNSGSWTNLLYNVLVALDNVAEKTEEELLSIRNDFSNARFFSKTPQSNHRLYKGVYINLNHTAGHSLRSIVTLLNAYEVSLDETVLLIRKHSKYEPERIKLYFKNEVKNDFSTFLTYKGFDENQIILAIKNIEFINSIFDKMKASYNDFFLFDQVTYFQGYKSRFFEYLNKHYFSRKDLIKVSKLVLGYLENYYKNNSVFKRFLGIQNKETFQELLSLETNNLFVSLKTEVVSSHKLYGVMRLKYSGHLTTLGDLNNARDFFSLCELLLSNKFGFSSPFISKDKNRVLSHDQILLDHIYQLESFSFDDVKIFAEKGRFKLNFNVGSLADEIQDKYVRIDLKNFLHIDALSIDQFVLDKLRRELNFVIEAYREIKLSEYKGYTMLPDIGYPWSKYLLEGVIKSFLSDSFSIHILKAESQDEVIIRKE